MKFLVVSNRTAFDTLNGTYNTMFGYPTADRKTMRYAEPFVHPSNGTVAMPIENRCDSTLTLVQKAACVEYSDLISLGFFPDYHPEKSPIKMQKSKVQLALFPPRLCIALVLCVFFKAFVLRLFRRGKNEPNV